MMIIIIIAGQLCGLWLWDSSVSRPEGAVQCTLNSAKCTVHTVHTVHCAGHRSRRTYTTYNTSFCAYLCRYLYVIVSSAYLCRYLYVAKTRPSEWSVTWTPPQLSNPIHFSQTASSSSSSSSSSFSSSSPSCHHHQHPIMAVSTNIIIIFIAISIITIMPLMK